MQLLRGEYALAWLCWNYCNCNVKISLLNLEESDRELVNQV